MLPAEQIERFKPVFELVADGMTITKACQLANVSRHALYRAAKGSPEIRAQLAKAEEIGAEAMADLLYDIHECVKDAHMAKVVSENRRWLLARRHVEKYGDKRSADAERSNDLTAVLREAIARIPRPASDQLPIVDVEKVTISDIFGD